MVVAILGVWQLGWAIDVIPPIGLPSPFEIAIALWQLIGSGELWIHLEATLPRLGAGWFLGTAIAVVFCHLSGHWPVVRPAVAALGTAVGTVPAIALLPLFIIWFGAGEASMIATTALAAFIPAISNSFAAVGKDGVRPAHVVVVESLHNSLSVALAVLVAAEMIHGGFGLGALIYSAAELYRSDQIVAGCLVLAAIGLGLSALLRLAGRLIDH